MQNAAVKPSANERKKTRNKKKETKRFSTPAVYRLRHSETKNIVSRIIQCLIQETCFQRNMCETANQQSISSHMVVYMASNMINISTMFC